MVNLLLCLTIWENFDVSLIEVKVNMGVMLKVGMDSVSA